MVSDGIAVSKALSTVPDSITDHNTENYLICIQSELRKQLQTA